MLAIELTWKHVDKAQWHVRATMATICWPLCLWSLLSATPGLSAHTGLSGFNTQYVWSLKLISSVLLARTKPGDYHSMDVKIAETRLSDRRQQCRLTDFAGPHQKPSVGHCSVLSPHPELLTWWQSGSSLAPGLLGLLALLGSSSSVKRNGPLLQPSGSPGSLLAHREAHLFISELLYK